MSRSSTCSAGPPSTGTASGSSPGVFVPRARTTVVVEQAARRLQRYDRVVDLCCGAGAISVALLGRVGALDLVATDIDPDAVDVAAENIGDRGIVVAGDLFAPLPDRFRGAVDVIAVNAPYVPTASIATDADRGPGARAPRRPRRQAWTASTCTGGSPRARGSGSAPAAPSSSRCPTAQAEESAAAFTAAGFATVVERDDEVDGTCVVATCPPDPTAIRAAGSLARAATTRRSGSPGGTDGRSGARHADAFGTSAAADGGSARPPRRRQRASTVTVCPARCTVGSRRPLHARLHLAVRTGRAAPRCGASRRSASTAAPTVARCPRTPSRRVRRRCQSPPPTRTCTAFTPLCGCQATPAIATGSPRSRSSRSAGCRCGTRA